MNQRNEKKKNLNFDCEANHATKKLLSYAYNFALFCHF